MHRAYRIAFLAHGYEVLARRPELCTPDRDHRLWHALTDEGPGPLRMLDAASVNDAGEVDMLCAYAVRLLRRPGIRTRELLDLLGMLDPDRIVAIYYALPLDRRHAFRRDPACAYHVNHAPTDEIEAALSELAWADAEPLTEVGRVLARVAWAE
jgi:hypothetical protein